MSCVAGLSKPATVYKMPLRHVFLLRSPHDVAAVFLDQDRPAVSLVTGAPIPKTLLGWLGYAPFRGDRDRRMHLAVPPV